MKKNDFDSEIEDLGVQELTPEIDEQINNLLRLVKNT